MWRVQIKKKNILCIMCAVLVAVVATFSFATKNFEHFGTTKILFVGDMMFDRTLRTISEKEGYDHIFSCVSDYMKEFDMVVGNLEGPITDFKSQSVNTRPGEAGNTTFTFDPKVALTLMKHHVRIVHLGNNHVLDFGTAGLDSTEKILKENNVGYFGSPNRNLSYSQKIGSKRITFVSFNQFLGQNDPQETINEIWKSKRNSDFVVVYTHWGEEYVGESDYTKALAHRFIDSGADLVIGSHPHVIQNHEIYNGKHIFYSLGNFVFDQYWTEEVKTGLGVELTLRGDELLLTERMFDIKRDGTTCLINEK